MKIDYKNSKIDIDHKYYCIIEIYPDNLVGGEIYLDFDKDLTVKLKACYDEYDDLTVLLVIESDDLNKLNEGLNESTWQEEDILVNRKLINE